MASEDAEGQAAPARGGRAARALLRWREVLRFAAAPADDHLTKASDIFMVFERNDISFEDTQGTALPDAELTGKTADLILYDDSCYDLTLTLPAAPLPEFEAMITNEINFASPFREEEAHAFWRANEAASGDWTAHIGLVLKSEVARAQEAAAQKGLRLRRIVRLGADRTSSIYAAPPWLTGETESTSKASLFPRALRLPAAALGVFVLSVGMHMGLMAIEAGKLQDQAAAADQRLRAAASAAGFQRVVDGAVASARQNIEILAQMSEKLPDEIWLDRITLENDTIRLIGFGPSGAEAVRLLSEFEGVQNARSIGTVTRDNAQNVERFIIEFDFVRPAS